MSQTLSQIKSLLAAYDLHPRKRYGQNFLHDANKVRAILNAANIRPGETILEVGPGTGVLTEPMLDAGARIVAVEIDSDLCAILRERFGPDSDRFILLNCDVLKDKHTLNTKVIHTLKSDSFKLIANLPYQAASPLLVNLATNHPKMQQAIVMVQEEVGDRLRAKPGGKEYGPLGILVQAMCEVERITKLSPHCFWPNPNVASVVLRISRLTNPLTDHPGALAKLLQTLFSKRRKQIGSILGHDRPLPPDIRHSMRPEQLTVAQLVELSKRIAL